MGWVGSGGGGAGSAGVLQTPARRASSASLSRPFHSPPLESLERPPHDERGYASACNCPLRESGTISARGLETAFLQPSLAGLHLTLAGTLAQEIYSGESLLFLRKAAQLRQRAQPLFARHAPPLGPQPAESSDPGRRLDEARLRLHQVPEGVQGSEGPTPYAADERRRNPGLGGLRTSPPRRESRSRRLARCSRHRCGRSVRPPAP